MHQVRRPRRLLTEAQQQFSFSRRALALGGAQGLIAALLVGRHAYLAVAQHDRLLALAEANRARATLIPPRRGEIVDRTGKSIATNQSDFRVDLIPDLLEDKDKEIAILKVLLGLSDDEVATIYDGLTKAAGFQPVQVADRIDYDKFATVNLRLPDLPGVIPASGFSRLYPSGPAFAHLVGYVGTANGEDYKKDRNPLLVTPGFKIGKQGLEKMFDGTMRGVPGAKRAEVTARGRFVHQLETRDEVPGQNLRLTIDARLQDYLAERMGPESISGIVIDCTNGDILAMASMPAFDPNSFSRGITHAEWNMLAEDDHLPLVNKALQGLYPAGSTVKPMNALALLEAGVSPDETVLCTGTLKVGNSAFHCYRHGGHGSINMHRAIQQSCDIYFYVMARRIGTTRIAAMARELGLGEKFPLPVASQRFGTVPDPEWKQRKYHKEWTVSDTLNSAIGQGYTLVNPLQLAVMASRIASGRRVIPRLVHRRDDQPPQHLGISEEHLRIVRQAMGDVVGPGGTANVARMHVPGVTMGGKTGSAQVRHISAADRAAGRAVALGTQGEWKLRDHGLFIAFAPVDNPRFAAGFIHEHAGHGTFASQVARDCFTYLYDKPQAEATLAHMQEGWGGDINARMDRQRAAWQAAHAKPIGAIGNEEDVKAQENNVVSPTPASATAQTPPEEGSNPGNISD